MTAIPSPLLSFTPPPSTAGVARPTASKQTHRLLSSLAAAAVGDGDGGSKRTRRLLSLSPSAGDGDGTVGGATKQTRRLLTSFTASPSAAAATRLLLSASRPATLRALIHLLSLSSPAAIPLYRSLALTPWFRPSPHLAAAFTAVAALHHHPISNTAHPPTPAFHCALIEAFAARGLKQHALDTFRLLQPGGRKPYEAMIKGLCLMELPTDAEAMLGEMAAAGYPPTPFTVRTIVQGYGKLGLLEDMRRVAKTVEIDNVSANIVLSCYGDCGKLQEMVALVRDMRRIGVGFSVRTFNTVLNACPTVARMFEDVRSLPLSVEVFVGNLEGDEGLLVRELAGVTMFGWSGSEGKLDLHGCHTASAYLILLQWMEEMRVRFGAGEVVPVEISIVCGLGKHSRRVGESPVKRMVSEVMFRLESPMRIDRKNVGRFVAKGKVVRNWLC